MNEPDHAEALPVQTADETSTSTWSPDDHITLDDFEAEEEFPAIDHAVAFVSLSFIGAALRRGAWLWCLTALAGLVIGLGMYVKFPPAYQAYTSVLLTNDPTGDADVQSATAVSLASSEPVATSVIHQLGLQESVRSFISSYTVTAPSPQVLTITADASTSQDAIRQASALASAFLGYRANMLRTQQQLSDTALAQQVSTAQQQLASVNAQITQAQAQPQTPAVQAHLASLHRQASYDSAALSATEQNSTTEQATSEAITASMVNGSQVLDAATLVPRSLKKGVVFYVGVAFAAGLAIGLGIVIIRALVSDRVRRRADVAEAFGAPVGLSVPSRRRGPLPERRAVRHVASRRVVTYLSAVAARALSAPASLAVVAVDDEEEAARAVVSLATSRANQGKRVVVADLSAGGAGARLLHIKGPGVHKSGANMVVFVPDRDDVAPVGPAPYRAAGILRGGGTSATLVSVYDTADLILTLVTLDPAVGADHLPTWASDVVAIITAGRSSVTKVQATGDMIRLSGARLISAVLLGADPGDESLGVPRAADEAAQVG